MSSDRNVFAEFWQKNSSQRPGFDPRTNGKDDTDVPETI